MNNQINYKDFAGSITYSAADDILHGRVECIGDLITFDADTVTELEAAFKEPTDEYITLRRDML